VNDATSDEAIPMTNSSDARRDGPLTKRRTTLLLAAGALAGIIPGTARPNVEPQNATTTRRNPTAVPGFPNLKRLGPAYQVRMIGHRHQTLRVTTGDGQTTDFRESDLRFKIDSSAAGPLQGAPVIVPSGMGDRAWVFFATPAEIGRFIRDQG